MILKFNLQKNLSHFKEFKFSNVVISCLVMKLLLLNCLIKAFHQHEDNHLNYKKLKKPIKEILNGWKDCLTATSNPKKKQKHQ